MLDLTLVCLPPQRKISQIIVTKQVVGARDKWKESKSFQENWCATYKVDGEGRWFSSGEEFNLKSVDMQEMATQPCRNAQQAVRSMGVERALLTPTPNLLLIFKTIVLQVQAYLVTNFESLEINYFAKQIGSFHLLFIVLCKFENLMFHFSMCYQALC